MLWDGLTIGSFILEITFCILRMKYKSIDESSVKIINPKVKHRVWLQGSVRFNTLPTYDMHYGYYCYVYIL